MSQSNNSSSNGNRPGAASFGLQRHQSQLDHIAKSANLSDEQAKKLDDKMHQVAESSDISVNLSKLTDGLGIILENTKDLGFVMENAQNFGMAVQGWGADIKTVAEAFVHSQKQNRGGAQGLEEMAVACRAFNATPSVRPPLEALNEVMAALEDPVKIKEMEQQGIRVFDPEKLKKGERVLNPLPQIISDLHMSISADKDAEYAALFSDETARVLKNVSPKHLKEPSLLHLDALGSANSDQGLENSAESKSIRLEDEARSTGDPEKYRQWEEFLPAVSHSNRKAQEERLRGRPGNPIGAYPAPVSFSPGPNLDESTAANRIDGMVDHAMNIVTAICPPATMPVAIATGISRSAQVLTDDRLNFEQKVKGVLGALANAAGGVVGSDIGDKAKILKGPFGEIVNRAVGGEIGSAIAGDAVDPTSRGGIGGGVGGASKIMKGIRDRNYERSPGGAAIKPANGLLNGATSWLDQSTQTNPLFSNLLNASAQQLQSGPVQPSETTIVVSVDDLDAGPHVKPNAGQSALQKAVYNGVTHFMG